MIELVTFPLALDEELVSAARAELLARNSSDGEEFQWGYLLGVEGEAGAALPRASELVGRLEEGAVRASGGDRDYALSFLKAAVGRLPEAAEGVHYAGFHLDTHPEVDGTGGRELSRLLFNLADVPRRFRYAAIDRFELARRGHEVPRTDYQVVELPPGIEVTEIAIPPREAHSVHALDFWASLIPHVGADDDQGHFLASFEAVATRPSA